MKLSEFDYSLPKELIAQYPAKERDKSRLMVLDRKSKTISHKIFEDITKYFSEGDLLVLNDTKVIPARLFGRRKTGGKVEIFLLEKKNPVCEALLRPSARLKEGERITLESGDEVEVLNRAGFGRFIKFSRPLDQILKEAGHVPLPPYIARMDEPSDEENYQTVYAIKEGATASPTAGLHFTKELMWKIDKRMRGSLDSSYSYLDRARYEPRAKSRGSSESRDEIFYRKFQGSRVAYLTLHTNYGTFAPVKTEGVENHKMHNEYFELPEETACIVNETKKKGGKVFAVGTTTTRVLEHCSIRSTQYAVRSTKGCTNLFIYPGYEFKVVDHLITNFHLPKSTLLLLVSAFAGKEFIFEAYQQAIKQKYRFFSYGDAMLIL